MTGTRRAVRGPIRQLISAGPVARDVQPSAAIPVVTLATPGRKPLAVWTTVHERRMQAVLADFDYA
ncbi:hypothetical protein RKD27_009093 [Streptomyces sp. SAI-126]|uniref:hypothetical protein n=1 Tax=Streptomyces sp. NPDC008196 TaxID=3364819 RepID=UPI00247E0544|nr:hypothetical protein [Streptomyces sp. SAI-119]MDH6502280.1 hypothetical protein [Streptomyces sp. SAI-149]